MTSTVRAIIDGQLAAHRASLRAGDKMPKDRREQPRLKSKKRK